MAKPVTADTTEAKAKKRKRAARPIYMVVRKLVDPETGEVVGAFVPDSPIDRFLTRERGYKTGTQVRAELKQPRNIKFHRLVHGLGKLVAQSVDAFQGMDAHTTIKRLQGDANVCCTVEHFNIPDLGRVTRSIPESLAFDEMDEARFREFWSGICQHLIARYWPGLDEAKVDEMVGMMPAEVA